MKTILLYEVTPNPTPSNWEYQTLTTRTPVKLIKDTLKTFTEDSADMTSAVIQFTVRVERRTLKEWYQRRKESEE